MAYRADPSGDMRIIAVCEAVGSPVTSWTILSLKVTYDTLGESEYEIYTSDPSGVTAGHKVLKGVSKLVVMLFVSVLTTKSFVSIVATYASGLFGDRARKLAW
jgi:hypothetical protein